MKQENNDLTALTDLASNSFGGRVLFASDEWFAAAHNLLNPEPPVFIADKFTDFGKWMDGWESRRKRIPGHDWCIIQLGLRGKIQGFDIDTAFFTGNNAPRVSIQAAHYESDKATWPQALRELSERATEERSMGRCATQEEFALAQQICSHEWTELLPFTEMGSGYPETRHNLHRIENDAPWTHLRLNIYPDGGVARLRVFGSVTMDWTRIAASTLIDLVSAVHGGTVVKYSDAHYGHPKNLIGPGRGKTMADGWETARKKTRPAILKADPKTGLLQVPGKDWTILKLGHAGIIKEIEVDTNHFKGNFPESCILYGCYYSGLEKDLVSFSSNNNIQWKIVLPRVKLQAHTQHFFSIQENTVNLLNHPINYVRLEMFPDGGISRLRLFGHKAMTTSSITSKSKL